MELVQSEIRLTSFNPLFIGSRFVTDDGHGDDAPVGMVSIPYSSGLGL